ncbi:SGNH/GDSL hydrolase family protein [Prosthecobacter sp.]|uniref:SGNH/GDSL hydrolase family protein n=1 Tax=Prosthecobacter sp. TaxID=1965333 RepID=UPI00378346B6
MKSSRLVFLVVFTLISFAAQASAQTKVLFLGNSITKHGPKADIDWKGNWGMAASAEDKDYVHLVTKGLTEKAGTAPQVMVKNIADFERAYADYDVAAKLKEAIDFHADLIILAIGENVPALKLPEEKQKLQAGVTTLLNAVKGERKPVILVRSCFWANAAKDEVLQQACTAVGGIYVNISTLGKDESNYARSERPYKHAGVANHPGDKGMAAIAAALVKAVP